MPMVTAFALISCEPSRTAALAQDLADIPGVYEAYSVAGDVDIVAVIRVRSHEDLEAVVTRHIALLQGVRSTRTLLAFRAYSRHDLEETFSLGLGS